MDGTRFDALIKSLISRPSRLANALASDHAFDALNLTLERSVTRRTMQRAMSAAISTLALGAVSGADAKKKREKRKAKDKKRKDRPNQPIDWPQTCSLGRCLAAWPSNSKDDLDNREYCEFICDQCDGDDPRAFCIVDGVKPDGAPTRVARCCSSDSMDRCCDGQCISTRWNNDRCGSCSRSCIGPGLQCCDGFCADTRLSSDHCGGCDQPCHGPGMLCCDGRCVDTRSDPDHCNICFNRCVNGQSCCYHEIGGTRYCDQ